MNVKRTTIFISILGFILLVSAACGNDNEREVEEDAVAVVNGEEITQSELDFYFDQMLMQYAGMGMDLGEDEEMLEQLRMDTLHVIINERLLVQKAEEEGHEVPEEEVESEMEFIVGSFDTEEELDQALEASGLTLDEFEQQLRQELLIEQLIGDVEVTEEEIEEEYEMYQEQFGEDIDMDEMRPMLEEGIADRKMFEKRDELANELREESDVEVLI